MNEREHEEPLDPRLRDLIADYRSAPQPLDEERRDRIFARVQAARATRTTRSAGSSTGAARSDLAGRPRHRLGLPRRSLRWIAAAAVLVIGIGIGRLLPSETTSTKVASAPSEAPRWSQETTEALYLLATRDYLDRTATLLTEFRQAALRPVPEMNSSPGDGTVRWAGDLLLETRLLLDSPASEDARLRTLLSDLELILAEIVQLTEAASPQEREQLRRSLEERSVFLRLQQVIPAQNRSRGA